MRSAGDDLTSSLRPTRTLVSATGPAGNIGDALIRREAVRWAVGTSDELVVYVGEAPDVWLRQLGLPTGTRVLRSKRSVARWLWLIATAPRRPVLVFESGEIPLDRGNVLRELVFLAETVLVRLKGGVVVRPPRGIRAPTQPATAIHAFAARLSPFALWRDAASAALAGGTRVVPDIGFGAGIRPGVPWENRRDLVVSLRGTRPMPNGDWIEAVRGFAASEGLRIRTVVQVREDEERSRDLADALDGTFEPWGDTDAITHEVRLRERYDVARLVISDRMHVLVLAALSGAAPLELVPSPTHKITAAFATIGLADTTADAATMTATEMQERMRRQIDRIDEITRRIAAASADLTRIEDEIRTAIRTARA
ncbi:hypothetical protein NH287_06405 [Microbacterium sp. CnD16-F]|uniref:hypothetical protein n=1 Tax=Microbacterium sp. CnD16-F TaxID=2954493 RepID=UPI0020981960|nr:hypothetical protein [Microbacterium sp. CnD16-F]MCO7203130.1 hypothetical protein [Microbacterium sp. CnD16-F]